MYSFLVGNNSEHKKQKAWIEMLLQQQVIINIKTFYWIVNVFTILLLKKCVKKLSILTILQCNLIQLNTIQYNSTDEMCDKVVNRCFLAFINIPDWCKTQEMCDRVISEDLYMLVYCLDGYKTLKMCDEADEDCLAASKTYSWLVCYK